MQRVRMIIRHYWIFLVIFVAAFLFVFSLSVDSCVFRGEWCGQDIDQYKDYSDSLLAGKGYSAHAVSTMYFTDFREDLYIPEILRMPAYPVILTLTRLFFNESSILLYLNYIFYALLLLYTYVLTKKFFNRPLLQFVTVLLVAFSPVVVFYTAYFGDVDIFEAALTVGFTYHTFSLVGESSRKNLHAFFAVLFGILAVMGRQNAAFFMLPLLFLLIYSQTRKSKKRSIVLLMTRLKPISIIAVCLLLSLMIWSARTYVLAGRFTPSAYSGMQLLTEQIYFTPFPNSESERIKQEFWGENYGKRFIQARLHEGKTIPHAYAQLDRELHMKALDYVLANQNYSFPHFLKGFTAIVTAPSYVWEKRDFFAILRRKESLLLYSIFLSMIVYPVLALAKKPMPKGMTILWASSFVFLMASAFYHGTVIGSRGSVPIYPMLILIFLSLVDFFLRSLWLRIRS